MNDRSGIRELAHGRTLEWRWTGGGGYADALWTRDFSEDDEADWPYPGNMLEVRVLHGGRPIGSAAFSYLCEGHGGHLACFNIFVSEEGRRTGIASAMYDHAEIVFGDQVLPYPGNEGGAIRNFWRNRLRDDPDLLDRFAEDIGRACSP